MFLLSGFILMYIYKLPLKALAKQNERQPREPHPPPHKNGVSRAERRNEKREFMRRCSGRCGDGEEKEEGKQGAEECYKQEV